jgi:hypothetical protein
LEKLVRDMPFEHFSHTTFTVLPDAAFGIFEMATM